MQFECQQYKINNPQLDKIKRYKRLPEFRPTELRFMIIIKGLSMLVTVLGQLHTNQDTTTCFKEAARRREDITKHTLITSNSQRRGPRHLTKLEMLQR
jgi:hypothetical protein